MSTVRISGVVMAPNKHLRIALRGIFGIGNTRALEICETMGIDPGTKIKEISEELFPKIQAAVNSFEVEGDLRRRVATNIKRLIDIKCYRGLRHKKGLPVRGQRTKTNAKTRKGRKRSVSSGSS
ncbi:MAG: 30S ribosomal protein S13 [Gammaproteobacteria bacterium]